MSDKENKIDRLKKGLIKIQGKIQVRMDDIQDQVQTKFEKSKKFISHLSEESRSSVENNNNLDLDNDTNSIESVKSTPSPTENIIPSFVIHEPDGSQNERPESQNQNAKEICTDFINIEKNSVLYRRSLSATNLSSYNDDDDDNSDTRSSSESCFSCVSSSDER